MIWNSWRQRLTYLVMSAFVAWHTLAMVIAPAPASSVLVGTMRAALQPYLTLFGLDNRWDFFAPTIGSGSELHYSVEDAAGARHSFTPSTPRCIRFQSPLRNTSRGNSQPRTCRAGSIPRIPSSSR
jgi:hypothetical protein